MATIGTSIKRLGPENYLSVTLVLKGNFDARSGARLSDVGYCCNAFRAMVRNAARVSLENVKIP